MTTKQCFRCKETKPIGEFYRHPMMSDGHLGKCKTCNKADVSLNYRVRREQYAAYERERNQRPERKAAKIRYHASGVENRLKNKARAKVAREVRAGRLSKSPCIHCGSTKVQAHHDDYSLPLDVKWVCFKCHREKEHGQSCSALGPAKWEERLDTALDKRDRAK